jgi:hypothetical protein
MSRPTNGAAKPVITLVIETATAMLERLHPN